MKINLVERKNPLDRAQPAKWYANAVNIGVKDLDMIAKDIAGRSSLTRGDIQNVLSNFVDRLPGYLMDGFSVKLGEFGTVRLSLKSEGAPTAEAFNANGITARVVFTPSSEIKKELTGITYQREV